MYNPLDDSHYQKCQEILQRCADGKELAQACIDCGWPAEEYLAQLQSQEKQAMMAKQKFFPGRL